MCHLFDFCDFLITLQFDFIEALKVFFMTADTRFTMDESFSNGDVPVFDMKGYSIKHIAKTLRTFSALRTYMNFTQVRNDF